MSRMDMHRVTVFLNGKSIGTFDKRSGGTSDSETTKYRPGSMGGQISLGGPKTTENVTVERLYKISRDSGLCKILRVGVGKFLVNVVDQPLDREGHVYGFPTTFSGILKSVKIPDADSESSAAALMTLEVDVAGTS